MKKQRSAAEGKANEEFNNSKFFNSKSQRSESNSKLYILNSKFKICYTSVSS